MPYLNLDVSYHEHPKTIRLMALLGPLADALPVRLWAYCAKVHPKDGAMIGYKASEVEAAIRWRGKPGKAVRAMLSTGFIQRVDNGYACHDWHDHEGHLEAFSRRAKAGAKARWDKYASSTDKHSSSNAPTVPSLPTVPTIPTKPTVPNVVKAGSVDCSELELTWYIKGDHYGKRIQDLDPEYCGWALGNLTVIGEDYRRGLKARIAQKKSEASGMSKTSQIRSIGE